MLRRPFISVLLLLLVTCCCTAKFSWSTCGPNAGIKINKLQMSPDPIQVPGDFYVTVDEILSVPMKAAIVEMHVVKHGFFKVKVPCISHFGSCTYDDTCTVLDKMHTWSALLGDIAAKIKQMYNMTNNTYTCPVPPQHLSVNHFQLFIPKPSSNFVASLLNGDFTATIRLKDKATKKEIFCMDVDVSLKTQCSGFICIG